MRLHVTPDKKQEEKAEKMSAYLCTHSHDHVSRTQSRIYE